MPGVAMLSEVGRHVACVWGPASPPARDCSAIWHAQDRVDGRNDVIEIRKQGLIAFLSGIT